MLRRRFASSARRLWCCPFAEFMSVPLCKMIPKRLIVLICIPRGPLRHAGPVPVEQVRPKRVRHRQDEAPRFAMNRAIEKTSCHRHRRRLCPGAINAIIGQLRQRQASIVAVFTRYSLSKLDGFVVGRQAKTPTWELQLTTGRQFGLGERYFPEEFPLNSASGVSDVAGMRSPSARP